MIVRDFREAINEPLPEKINESYLQGNGNFLFQILFSDSLMRIEHLL